jgi:hypothetical protein
VSYAVNMVPGTAKEIAAVGLARMLNKGRGDPVRVNIAGRNLRRAERREWFKLGYLPGGIGAHPHAVALGVDLVEVEGEHAGITYGLKTSVAATLQATVEGDHHLWFDSEGNAFVSFELEGDAVLFRLALS